MHQHSLFKSLLSRKVAFGATLGSAVLFMVIGVIVWGGFNTVMEATNTMEFCISCHEMEENVYQEYKGTPHDGNRSGVGAGCPDCHVPRPWVHKIVRKIKASNEIWHKIMGTVDTPEKFEQHRLTMARRVWTAMKETDSRECRNCHDWDTMNPERQKPRARNQHVFAMENGNTCIDCHKGIAHKAVHKEISEEELEEWAQPIESYKTEIPASFKLGLLRAAETEAEAEAAEQQATQKERDRRKAQALAQQQKIDAAVAQALAAQGQNKPATTTATTASAGIATQGFGVDWSESPQRQITLFYPGQTSMEWTLVGKFHGGSRPFKAGDRCTTCHDKETADMGQKMVTGQKAEPTPPEGKRAAIPVTVQAAYDESNLYFRFQWEDTDHVPVPFIEGGKMDPDNQVKLALMLATDEVEYASQAGCWGTCHEDLRTMPGHPDDPAGSGLKLDLSNGVTKYIKESRTKVEEKGRRGKKLGGWDKLKDDNALQAERDAHKYMDLVRWNSNGKVENGHVLEQRVMNDGSAIEAQGWKDAGTWTVVIKRPLTSTTAGDLSIEPETLYNFGFAIHDDYTSARFHHVSLGYKLGLDNSEAELNAVKAKVNSPAATSSKAATVAPAGQQAAATNDSIDWSKSSERQITLFYPGQTSMEWMLVGKYHGGARPFRAGDRCTTCHDKETADMGQKMVTGQKAEPTPPTGKRPAIPVTVQATHDAEKLYLRFQWEGTQHVPIPFVDDGKMDPENQTKLALMLATDEAEYASQAGCWGTCHEDLRTMPGHPEDPAAAGLNLDVNQGVTKYIKESRTKVEEKGRRGKKLGGWDKLKADGDIQAELNAHKFMDLLRISSGTGAVEDGHVLEQRIMTGGQGLVGSIKEEAGYWTVTLERKLKSDNPGDITIESGKLYNFGFAIHDDYTNARFHHVSLGYKLGLDNSEAEINALAQ
ncbi:MAG: NapC/NirT family cytochrome c [Candidatus Thiodiazotropha sp. (ex Lucinoma kastoroae)]|nr:NapC/NirT family cytochrome c [Candidatus Thiodiazotropha sp. (ex Lucinoma kastoroae)]MCU7858757.1 NapC/NirT family cytochrome c [Candidatus Thiodiazotropha sp. (ex Lucinoma kastoroae)]